MSVSAKEVCKILNELSSNDDGFVDGLLNRFYVSDKLAEESRVSCSKLDGSNHYSTSALGVINALTDEVVGYNDDGDFVLLSEYNKIRPAEWDKYEEDLIQYNKDNDTNHEPEKRPEHLKG